MNIEVAPAGPEQQPVLANLLELYIHDFSEFYPISLGKDGRFGYSALPLYWVEPGRHPFVVRVDGRLAGFALVKAEDAGLWDMAEFFITRAYRRRGIGTQIAHEVWRRFPGRWEVRVMLSNAPALRFWERAITAFTGQSPAAAQVQRSGIDWRVFSFEG